MNEGVEAFNAGSPVEAEKKFQSAVTLYKDNHRAWYNLGQVRDARKKYDEAAEAYENAVKVEGNDPMYHYRLGKALYESGKLDKAQTHLERAVKDNPKLFKAHYFLGKAYLDQDKPKEAALAWTEAATANPTFGKPFNALGTLYIRWDMLPAAVKVLENGSVNVIDPLEKSDVLYHLGFAYEKQNNLDKAVKAYTEALELQKGNIDALRQRGITYYELKKPKEAQKDLDAFVKSGGGGDAFQLQAANQILMQIAMKR
jgi:tetratricopeptide (TPR) repeat protein